METPKPVLYAGFPNLIQYNWFSVVVWIGAEVIWEYCECTECTDCSECHECRNLTKAMAYTSINPI